VQVSVTPQPIKAARRPQSRRLNTTTAKKPQVLQNASTG
jgi:hypothetical protein